MRKVHYESRLHMLASLVLGSELNDSFEFKCRRLAMYGLVDIIGANAEVGEDRASLTDTGERVCYLIKKFAEQNDLALEYSDELAI